MISTFRRLTRSYVPLALATAVAALAGCANEPAQQQQTQRTHSDRYISLAPSDTELLYSLQADDKLLGVCNQCDYPVDVKHKPTVGSFTSIDLEKAMQLKPDTAFLVEGQEALADTIGKQPALHCQPVVLKNKHVRDIAHNLTILGDFTGHSKEAQPLFKQFLNNVDAVGNITAYTNTPGPKVFFCVWPQPLTTVGADSYLNEAITICGGYNIAAKLQAAYPQFNTEQLLAMQPDVIILPHEAEGQSFIHNAPWTSLKAVVNKRVYYLPPRDDDRLSRPTLRILDGLYWLAERLHPELADKIRAEAKRTRSQG